MNESARMIARLIQAAIVGKKALRRHWAALALALLVSGIYGSHHIFIPRILRAQGETYRPLTFSAHADASVYGLRANAVYTGQWLAGDISLPERSANPSPLPPLNSFIMGTLGRIVGSLERAFILSDFLFPSVIFIMLYLLAFEVTRARALAIFFAAFFIFIPTAILPFPPLSRSYLETFLARIMPDPFEVLYFVRFDYPKITFLFFTPALYGALRAITRQERWSVWLAGVSFGLMFYTYLYDWVYFFIGISLAGAMLVFSGRYRECVRLVKILGIGLIMSAPYWYNLLLLRQLPHYDDLTARIGVETGRFFRWASVWKSYVRISALAVVIGSLAPPRVRPQVFYLAGLLGAYIVAVNIQLITGFNPHPDHWYRVSFLPLALAMLAGGYWAAKRYVPARALSYGAVAAILCAGLLFGRSLASQYYYSLRDAQYYVVARPYAAAYAWLTLHAPKRSLVGSLDSLTNNELMLYTPQRTFLLNGLHTTAADETIWKHLMETSAVFGIPGEAFAALLKDKNTLFYLFLNEYRDNSFDSAFRYDAGSDPRLPEDVARRMTAAYEKMRAEPRERIGARMDYVLAGPREEAIAPFKLAKDMEKAYDADGVRIYKAIKR